jgi:hypothetical protein
MAFDHKANRVAERLAQNAACQAIGEGKGHW